MPLPTRLLLCAAACALTLGCGGDSAPASPTAAIRTAEPEVADRVNAAASAIVATSAPAAAATQAPVPSATQAPQATVATAAATRAPVPAATPTPKPATRPAPVTLQVTLGTAGQTFEPHQIHGNFDDNVVVTLTGSDERHSFTVPILGIDQAIDRDKTVVVRFVLPLALGGPAAEGTFAFYCRIHGSPTSGMHGFLIFH